jgi:hypothetical protein
LEPLQQINRELQGLPSMISTETAKALEPLSQIGQELRSLPQEVAEETATALEPLRQINRELSVLSQIKMDIQQALTAYDKMTAAMRSTLEALTVQQHNQISQLLKPISDSSQAIVTLKTTIKEMSTNIQEEITAIETTVVSAETKLNKMLPRWWRTPALLVISAALGATIAMTGYLAFEKLLPPTDVQKNATWAQTVWNKATPEEKELLNQIVSRPVN